MMDQKILHELAFQPSERAIAQSQERVLTWWKTHAPTIYWDEMESPVGTLYMAQNSNGLVDISFGVSKETFFSRLNLKAQLIKDVDQLSMIRRQLEQYFEHNNRTFSVPVDYDKMTPFQQKVLKAVSNIPAGKVMTYKEVAEAIGNPKASRAVGNAVANNPVPIIIPCHRVVASNGGLGGYSGGRGIEDKVFLLQLEGAMLS